MEIARFKFNEFDLNSFIEYYNDNVEELLMEYPNNISRVCLIDRDYMDVVIFDEDYEDIKCADDYKDLLINGQYDLHFAIGKTYEGNEKIELIDGQKYVLNHYMDDIYEDNNTIKNIGDLNINVDNLMGLLFELEEGDDEIVITPVDFEHGGDISQPVIRKVDDCGDLEEVFSNIIDRFIEK